MARYYKTARGGQLDFMKQLPVNLMMKGIEVADQANDQIYAQTDLLGNQLAQIRHLNQDSDRVKAIQGGYTTEIDSVTKSLMENPADFRKQMPLVRGLARKLNTDFNTGEIAGIQGEANRVAEWDKTYKPMVAKGEITPDAYNAMKSGILRGYKGYNYDPNTGTGNSVQTEDIYKTQDFNKLLQDNIKGIKASSKGFKQEADGGKWLVTQGGKEEWVSAARVAQLASDTLLADQNVMGYLKQGGKYGYLRGVTDQAGNFIQPYKLDSKGNPVFNEESILAAPIRGAVGREAFRQTSTETGLQVNPYSMEQVKFGNDLEKMKTADSIRDTNKEADAALKWKYDEKGIRLRADLAASKASAAKPSSVKKVNANDPAPQISASTDGVTAYSPFGGVNALTLEKLQHDQRTAKEEVAELLTLSKNPNISVNERDNYQQRADEAQARVSKSYELLISAKDYADAQLLKKGYTPQEIKVANDKYNSTITPMRQQLEAVNSAIRVEEARTSTPYGGPLAGGAATPNYTDNWQKLQTQKTKLLGNINRLESVHSDLQGAAKSWFKTNSDKTVQKLEGVGLGVPEKETLYKQLAANPTKFLLREASNEDKPVDYDDLSGILGDDPKKSIEIERINPPAAGIGVTVSFRLKDSNGKPYGDSKVMTIPNSMNSAMSQSLAKGTHQNQKQLAATLGNEFKINFLSAIKNKINDSVNPGESQPAGYYSYFDEKSNYTSQIRVVPVTDKNNAGAKPVSYKVYVSLQNGTYVPLPISKDKSNEFPSEEALADAFVNFASKK